MLHLVQTHLYTLLIYNELFCTNHIRIYLSTGIIGINCPLPVSPEGTYGLRSVCLSVCLSVSLSVTLLDPAITLKVLNIFFMKLETWIDGNMGIMHVISFCSYVKNCGCYGNQKKNILKMVEFLTNFGAGGEHNA